jgi:hypothetical protein
MVKNNKQTNIGDGDSVIRALASHTKGHDFKSWPPQTQDVKMGCGYSARHLEM